ncbi:MAG: phenylalanine--tRNA ligase subunit alpha [Clostridiales bacterium]|jgi:phenylalanyl-tRNA synthetase alpha chain|nr:phenylalanine--tRNA ligase subunit alpha [Clostridiales bacterium]
MQEKIRTLTDGCKKLIGGCETARALGELRARILGKNGELTALLKGLKDMPDDERPTAGKIVNEAREALEREFAAAAAALESAELKAKLDAEKIDITIDSGGGVGSLHPLTLMRRRICDFFTAQGFTVCESPEIETDYYNFEALNVPADHPAREVQDTFFITDKILLRSQTSTGQIRAMEKMRPPLKIISPGPVYRSDDPDATHTPMFHQLEGLVIDKGIAMSDLKGTLDLFAKEFFGENSRTRFRPSYFPFTEPSVEVDASSGSGWIEILGAGMVNRNVLRMSGIDPDVYSGFAFGMGLNRITNIIHAVRDARIPFENDARFLRQFG